MGYSLAECAARVVGQSATELAEVPVIIHWRPELCPAE